MSEFAVRIKKKAIRAGRMAFFEPIMPVVGKDAVGLSGCLKSRARSFPQGTYGPSCPGALAHRSPGEKTPHDFSDIC
jgi:hypothetical protein